MPENHSKTKVLKMPLKIRQAVKSDFEKIHELTAYCYGLDPAAYRERFARKWQLTFQENYLVELDRHVVANARLIPYEQNIRGVWKKMGGVGMVVSEPSTRRKGHVRKLMVYLLEKMAAENYAISCLYPFKDTFYSAFNYTNITANQFIKFNPKFLKRWENLPKGYSLKRFSHSEGFVFLKSLHEKAMAKIHGGVKRGENQWATQNFPNSLSYVVCFNPNGVAEGILRAIPQGFSKGFDWAETGQLEIKDFFSLTPKAKQALLHFLYLHTDQIIEALLPINPQESELYPWLHDYYLTTIKTTNIWQARIINIQLSLENLPVPCEGETIIRVRDPLLPANDASYLLVSKNRKLTVQQTEGQKADFEFSIEGLTALLYGILSPAELEAFGWLKILTVQKTPLLTRFPRVSPFMSEEF